MPHAAPGRPQPDAPTGFIAASDPIHITIMKSFLKAPASRSGFTLIELMVVMLLITIVLGVAIPKFSGGRVGHVG